MSTRTVGTTTRLAGGFLVVGLLAAACGSDDETSVADATEHFCTAGKEYVAALDTYGRLFFNEAFTVGDVKSAGDGLDDAREEATSALDDLEAANEDASITESTVPLAVESVTRIGTAEKDFADVVDAIDDDTPLVEAGTLVSSAAFQLQVSWLILLGEVGCVENLDESLDKLTAYVAAIQTDLATLGYYDGPVDGIYGPLTVAAVKELQAAAGLPETGLLDRPTQAAMAKLLEGKQSAQVTALQGLLAGLGYWNGPIDGIWTDELGDALAELQSDLGLPPTGTMDAATLLAIEDALAAGLATDITIAPTPTEPPPPATAPPTQPPATQPPATQPPATQPPATQPPATAAPAETTVIDVLAADGRFTILLNALEIAGLTEVLAGAGQFTMFAPTDDAFNALPPGTLDTLLADPVAMRALLLDHVLDSGAIASGDLVAAGALPTAGEGSITVTDAGGSLVVNDTANVVTADVTASNGVVHAIDAVLVTAE